MIRLRRSSSVSLVEAALQQAKQVSELNIFTVMNEEAKKEAVLSDARTQKLSAIDGKPVAVKDCFCTADLPTSAGSKILKGWQA